MLKKLLKKIQRSPLRLCLRKHIDVCVLVLLLFQAGVMLATLYSSGYYICLTLITATPIFLIDGSYNRESALVVFTVVGLFCVSLYLVNILAYGFYCLHIA